MANSTVDEKTLLVRIRTVLRALLWDGTVEKVFQPRSCRVTAMAPAKAVSTLIPPLALIRPGICDDDPEHPKLQRAGFTITLVNRGLNDDVGEAILLGSNNDADRGLLDVQRAVYDALATLTKSDGVPIVSRGRGMGEAALGDGDVYVAWRDLRFEARISSELT